MQEKKPLTLKQLQKATAVPVYIIKYLRDCGRLPVVRESQGRGYPTLYHSDSIQVVKKHVEKGSLND